MKRILSLMMMLGLCLLVMGQGKMTPQAQMKIERMRSSIQKQKANGQQAKAPSALTNGQVRLVVELSPDDMGGTFAQIKAIGATVCARLGRQAVIDIPLNSLEALQRIEGVVRIDKGHKGHRNSDVTRQETGVNELNGPTLPATATAYTGKGITVCLIDGGFDFQHRAFKDDEGNTRIKCVYLMGDDGGNKYTVDDPEAGTYTFPGSVYDTPELIATLTTDDDTEYHGTHTAGIAAGSLSPQGFGGMAPEADIVLIPLKEVPVEGLDPDDMEGYLELALAFADAYARQSQQPMVLSTSLNSHDGPHDGTSAICQAISDLSEDMVPVFSAGNEGGYPIHLYCQFTEAKPSVNTILMGILEDETGTYEYLNQSSVAGYTRTGSELSVKLTLKSINPVIGRLTTVWSSQECTATPGCEEVIQMVSSDDDATLAQYFEGEVGVAAFDNGDGRLGVNVLVDGGTQKLYLFQLTISGSDGTEVDLWDDVAGFAGTQMLGLPGLVDGDNVMSAGDWTCSDRVISVGAYCANVICRDYDGETYDTSMGDEDESYVQDDIAWFSSFGTSFNDISQPTVCAPGVNVVSSVNHYFFGDASVADGMQWQGYPYSAESGTSMACPAVAGIVALWLQANPTMTFDEVMDVISQTSRNDDFTAESADRWGFGKIDAAAGINYILNVATDVKDLDTTTESSPLVYDLQGRQLSKMPVHGIVVTNGHKVIVK